MSRSELVLSVMLAMMVAACLALASSLLHLITVAASVDSTIPQESWERELRLPRHLLPLHYDLLLHPDLESGLFSGEVAITIEATAPADYLVVHAKDLNITETALATAHGDQVPLRRCFEYTKHEFWVVLPEERQPVGNYTLRLSFAGSLTGSITGFYRSIYTNIQGQQVAIATSKFQPTYARKAFPCFDEPSFKSSFSTRLVRPSEGYIALSNMPVEVEVPDSPRPGLTTVRFERSVPMVTYLACFIVCDFAYQEQMTRRHNTQFRVYATPQQRESVRYALDIGANMTDYFTNYFQLAYPLPKQDMIAIPDFVSGAMEHWGLITFRETNLLYSPEKSSAINQQRVAAVVSHELAHQWFGNLVTLEWWDDLWLNEGFASYMEYKGVAECHPDWGMMDQFLIADLHGVMNLDATLNSHPIVQDVLNPDQITEIFDTISYSKGASVLRMLEHFMGPEEFRTGIYNFLLRYEYSNAVTADLWRELEQVSTHNLSISDIMDTWTRQMGFPVLMVEATQGGYRVRQQRFLLNPAEEMTDNQGSSSPFGYKWEVPVTWITSNTPTEEEAELVWLSRDQEELVVEIANDTEWVKFNVGQYGFYRVNYPTEDWAKLASLLLHNHLTLSVKDRASLLNDAFSLAEAGHISYSIPLSMTQYLSKEEAMVPWETVYEKLNRMRLLLSYTPAMPLLLTYLRQLVSARYASLGWSEGGSHLDQLNRNSILDLACKCGVPECNAAARRLFEAWLDDENFSISPNLRSLVYKYGMAGTSELASWDLMLTRYMQEPNPQEKRKLMSGLAQVKEPWLVWRLLDLAKNESVVRSQDYFSVLVYVSSNPVGSPLAWAYLRSNWSYLVNRFGLNDRYLGRMPKVLTADFSSATLLAELESFLAANPEAGAGARARLQALEQIRNNMSWLANHLDTVHGWLLNWSKMRQS